MALIEHICHVPSPKTLFQLLKYDLFVKENQIYFSVATTLLWGEI